MHVPSPAGDAATQRCEHCSTDNASGARFCKRCGTLLVAPPACPSCAAPISAAGARFCPSCGTKLVTRRLAVVPLPAEPTLAPKAALEPKAAVEDAEDTTDAEREAPAHDARKELESLAASLPAAKPRSSNVLSNVLTFVAAIAVFLVVMYEVNKDAKKEVSPFMGGPPPAMGGQGEAAQVAEPAKAAEVAEPAKTAEGGDQPAATEGGGGPVRGTIKLSPSLQKDAPSSGTLFLVVRPQGMPDKGPPLAVKRISAEAFPTAFEVGPSDVMMQGLGFDGPFDLYVRLDQDGNAMTKTPGDIVNGTPKAVPAGASNVEIVLDKRL